MNHIMGERNEKKNQVLLPANADRSEKLTPFVTGNSRGPRSFQNVYLKTLLTEYHTIIKVWINSDLFKQFIEVLHIKIQNKDVKIVVFIDFKLIARLLIFKILNYHFP